MSAVEQWPSGSAFEPPPREPPPVVFAEAAARAARPVVPRASVDRKPLSHAAARRRTSWLRRLLALVVLLVAIAGVLTAVTDSKITLQGKRHGARHASTFLSAQQLGLARHRHHHRAPLAGP
jgi:hypothetical protein